MSIKEKIREIEGPDMKENMQDQIRQWFIECRLVLQSYFATIVIFSEKLCWAGLKATRTYSFSIIVIEYLNLQLI